MLAYRLVSPDPRIGDDDFQVFYAGAAAIARGHSPYVGDFVSPPWFALALVPLTWLPLATARGVWLLLNLGLLVTTTGLCARLTGLHWPARRLVLAALLCGLWPPVEFGLKLGQNSLLVWTLVLVTLLAACNARWTWAGLALALTCIKPQLVFLFAVGLAVRAVRQRALARVLAAAGASLADLAALVLLVAPASYADLVALRPRTWDYWGSTVALPPLLADALGSQPLALLVYAPVAVAGAAIILAHWARADSLDPRPDPAEQPSAARRRSPVVFVAALTAAATLGLTPYAYPYDAVLLQLPVFWLIAWALSAPRTHTRAVAPLAVGLALGLWLLERPADYTPWRYLGLLPPLALVAALLMARRTVS